MSFGGCGLVGVRARVAREGAGSACVNMQARDLSTSVHVISCLSACEHACEIACMQSHTHEITCTEVCVCVGASG